MGANVTYTSGFPTGIKAQPSNKYQQNPLQRGQSTKVEQIDYGFNKSPMGGIHGMSSIKMLDDDDVHAPKQRTISDTYPKRQEDELSSGMKQHMIIFQEDDSDENDL